MATITRANFEFILIARIGGIMTACGLDGTAAGGTNTDLNDPIGYGIRQSDGTVAAWELVTTADIATVAAADQEQMIDLAELRGLQNCMSNLALVDIEVGERNVKYNQLSTRLKDLIQNKQESVDNLYDFAVASVSSAVWDLNFAEHDEDNVDELGR